MYWGRVTVEAAFSFPSARRLRFLQPRSIFLQIVVLGPMIETLLFQALPIELARIAGVSKAWRLLPSVLLFASAHFFVTISKGITAGVIFGLYSAFAYVRSRESSVFEALCTTICIHSGINLITFAAIIWHRNGGTA
jgi:hypothetical protein